MVHLCDYDLIQGQHDMDATNLINPGKVLNVTPEISGITFAF